MRFPINNLLTRISNTFLISLGIMTVMRPLVGSDLTGDLIVMFYGFAHIWFLSPRILETPYERNDHRAPDGL